MTSGGRLLSGRVTDRAGMAAALKDVLAAYARLPDTDRRPETVAGEVRPQPAPPPGGLVLTVYDRPLARSGAGTYRLPAGSDWGGNRTEAPHGQRSSLWLTRQECESLIPADPAAGATHPVPAKMAKRIWLYALMPQSLWVVEETWKPDSVRSGDLAVTVEEVTPRTVRLRVHGSVLLTAQTVLRTWPDGKYLKDLENRYDARLEGTIVYDRSAGRIVRWDMLALGDYTGRWFAGNAGWKEAGADAPLPVGFAFELDQAEYGVPPERRRPRSFVHAYLFRDREEFYWDPDRWLADWRARQPK